MNTPKISKRLLAAANFARCGNVFADVGTDHAYLPIYLCASGISKGGVASDVNEGPIKRAKANIFAWGVENKINVACTNGLCGIEKYAPNDIFILGMGGELIVKIIDEAKWVRKKDIRLILQPMTHPEDLRKYLLENGFSIIDECLVKEEKIYQIICAEYSGKQDNADGVELLFGKTNIERRADELFELIQHLKIVYQERLLGKQNAGQDALYEKEILNKLENINGGKNDRS